MPYPLPLTRTEAYLAYKAGVIQQSDLKPSLAIPRNGIDAWLAYWTGLTDTYPVKGVGKNIFDDSLAFENGYIATYGNIVASQNSAVNPKYYGVVQNTDYTFSYSVVTDGTMVRNIAFYDNGKNFISRVQNASTETSVTVHAPEGACYMRFNFYNANGITATDFPASYLSNIQLEKGTQASAYEEYTGEPLILQEEEAYIAYLCGVINEYPEKCLRRVGAYLRYLISARWGRPDHPLNREELYLSLLKTQVIPSGDPSSDIVIEGTAKAAFQDLKMYGDTFQQTYTGKNLFNKNSPNMFVGYVGWNGAINSTNADRMIYIPCEPSTTYSIQKPIPSTNPKFRVAVSTDVPASGGTATVLTNDSYMTLGEATVTTKADSAYLMVYIWVNSSDMTLDEVLSGIQIEVGSSATSYEPYVGGQPSPNPDYPQPIQTVTGRQVVNIRGKNWFDYTIWNTTGKTVLRANAVTIENTTGNTLKLTNKIKQVNNFAAMEIVDSNLLLGKTATISAKFKNSTVPDTKIALYWGTANTVGTQIVGQDYSGESGFAQVTGNIPATFPSGADRIRAVIYANGGVSGDIGEVGTSVEWTDIQLELGSTATTYEPYISNNYEINLGKNLFDGTWRSGQYNSGEWQANAYDGQRATTDLIPVTGGDYAISLNSDTLYTSFININYFDKSKNWLGNRINLGMGAFSDTDRTKTFTLPDTAYYLAVTIRPYANYTGGTVVQNAPSQMLQVERASAATAYAPYFEPIELCKLDTYQDYIWKDGGEWKVHKATGVVIYDGSNDEDWSQDTSGIYSRKIIAIPNSLNVGATRKADSLSDHFRAGTANDYGIFFRNNKNTYYYPKSGITTVEEWRAWLSSNNINTLYPLATPTDTVITNQALINQLNALKQGGAENGTTYIKVNATDPNLPGLLYVEAPKYE